MDVAPHGHIVFEDILGLHPIEWVGSLEYLLEVLRAWALPIGLSVGIS